MLAKREDQASISISTIIKFSAQVGLINIKHKQLKPELHTQLSSVHPYFNNF